MNARKFGAVVGGAIFLGTFGVVQGLGAASASAAPADSATVTRISTPADPRDYRIGYREGMKAGREDAYDDCERTQAAAGYSSDAGGLGLTDQEQGESDYQRGFDAAYEKSFDRAYEEYCS